MLAKAIYCSPKQVEPSPYAPMNWLTHKKGVRLFSTWCCRRCGACPECEWRTSCDHPESHEEATYIVNPGAWTCNCGRDGWNRNKGAVVEKSGKAFCVHCGSILRYLPEYLEDPPIEHDAEAWKIYVFLPILPAIAAGAVASLIGVSFWTGAVVVIGGFEVLAIFPRLQEASRLTSNNAKARVLASRVREWYAKNPPTADELSDWYVPVDPFRN
jgi:hypothetical protein